MIFKLIFSIYLILGALPHAHSKSLSLKNDVLKYSLKNHLEVLNIEKLKRTDNKKSSFDFVESKSSKKDNYIWYRLNMKKP